MTLREAQEGKSYKIRQISTGDEALEAFLFTLGCYSGESIGLIAQRKSGCTVSLKDGRYHMDARLAGAIRVSE